MFDRMDDWPTGMKWFCRVGAGVIFVGSVASGIAPWFS